MGRMKEFALWLIKCKKLTDENIIRLAKREPWNMEDTDWLREQVALLRSGELEELMGVSSESLNTV